MERNRLNINFVLLFGISIFIGCCDFISPEANNDFKNNPSGVWVESFIWNQPKSQLSNEKILFLDSAIIKTSTLALDKNTFTLRILPAHRVLMSNEEKIVTSYSSDTIYSGIFQLDGDTIVFQINNVKKKVLFSQEDNNLYLEVLGQVDNDGHKQLEIFSFLWGHSMLKLNGTFRKID